jgi:hypothetical protein
MRSLADANYNHRQALPTREQVTRLQAALSEVAWRLPPVETEAIRLAIRPFLTH